MRCTCLPCTKRGCGQFGVSPVLSSEIQKKAVLLEPKMFSLGVIVDDKFDFSVGTTFLSLVGTDVQFIKN